jgi:hypothetical protein
VLWPWPALRSELPTTGGTPARHTACGRSGTGRGRRSRRPGASRSAGRPGQDLKRLDPGSGLASAPIARSNRAIGARRPAAPSSPDDRACGIAGSSRLASQARPRPVHRIWSSPIPRSASTACTRCFSQVDRRTRLARWPSNTRSSRVAWARSRPRATARPAAAGQRARVDLVVVQPGRGRSPCRGWDGPGAVPAPAPAPPAAPPASPAVGGLERHRGARRQGAQDRYQLGRIVGEVAVALLVAGLINHGDLGALAKHVPADLHSHQGLLPRARRSRSPGCRAEQGTGAPPT